MQKLEGKVAVVTGAASGIGKALSERLASAGMKVVLADIEPEALGAATAELERRGFEVTGVTTDVSDPSAVDALAASTLDAYGAVHVLCNNAGVLASSELVRPRVPLWEHSLSSWEWTFGVNFWGVLHGIRTFVPLMLRQQQEGHIVNTASYAGLISTPGLAIYGASKHAVVRISEALHLQLAELDSPLRVSVLCPEGVHSRLAGATRNRPAHLRGHAEDELDPGAQAELEQAFRERAGDDAMAPEEVADRVLDAIRGEQFYILPHENTAAIRRRMDAILERRNPEPPPAR
jgi:NAD(P)-dependent dehydrogenase (short-subunit alcohol dehydrogenase family)